MRTVAQVIGKGKCMLTGLLYIPYVHVIVGLVMGLRLSASSGIVPLVCRMSRVVLAGR